MPPALGLDIVKIAPLGIQLYAILFGHNLACNIYIWQVFYLIHIIRVDGEEQFVVLAAAQGAGDRVEFKLQGLHLGIRVNGHAAFLQEDAHAGLLADVEQLGGDAVGNIDHGGGHQAVLFEALDHIASGFRFELPADEVVVPFQLGLYAGAGQVDLLFAFQDLQAEVGGAHVAGDADEVAHAGAAAVGELVLFALPDGRHADDQAAGGGGRVAAHKVDIVDPAGGADAVVDLVQRFHGETVGQGDGDGDLFRLRVHGVDVRQVDDDGLVAQVLQRRIHQVEMDALDQHIGGDDGEVLAVVDHGGVITHALDGRRVAQGEVLRQVVDQAELAELVDVGALGLLRVILWHVFSVIGCELPVALFVPQQLTTNND